MAKGELFGIVGPDGAGKTSLFRILTTLLLANSGSAQVEGFDVVKDYKSIRKTEALYRLGTHHRMKEVWVINEWGGNKELVAAIKKRKQMILDDLDRLKEKYAVNNE